MLKKLVTNANEITAKEPEFWAKEWLPIPKNTLTMISAPGGTGKSFLSIQLAIKVAEELLIKGNSKKVLLWLSEDPLFLTKDRINKIFDRILTYNTDMKKKILDKIDIIGADKETLYFQELTEKQMNDFKKDLVLNYVFVVIDPLIAFYSGEENSNSEARKFMNILNRIAQEQLLSIVLIHHHNKDKEASSTRGAGAFVDAVRLLYTIETIKEEDKEIHPTKRKIVITKDNWGVKVILNSGEFERVVLPYKTDEIEIKNFTEIEQKTKKTNSALELI